MPTLDDPASHYMSKIADVQEIVAKWARGALTADGALEQIAERVGYYLARSKG